MLQAMRHRTIPMLALFSAVCISQAQDGFQVAFKNEQNDQFSSIKQTSDGGFIACGLMHTNEVRDDILLVRMDAHGDTLWTRTYGGGWWSDDQGERVIQGSDGFFYMTGQEQSYGGAADNMFLMKVDTAGTLVWARTHWVPNTTVPRDGRDLFEMPDGGFVVLGWPGFSVYRFDEDGVLTWTRRFSTGSITHAGYADQEGGIICMGTADSTRLVVMRLFGNGELDWARGYSANGSESGWGIAPTADTGYVVIGSVDSPDPPEKDMLIFRCDAAGEVVWARTMDHEHDDVGQAILQVNDGFVAVGTSDTTFDQHGFVLNLDADGDAVWSNLFTGIYWYRSEVVRCTDGGLAIAHVVRIPGNLNTDAYAMKLDSLGNGMCEFEPFTAVMTSAAVAMQPVDPVDDPLELAVFEYQPIVHAGMVVEVLCSTGQPSELPGTLKRCTVFPNPTRGTLRLTMPCSPDECTVEVHSSSGALVYRLRLAGATNDLPVLNAPGVYTLSVARGASREYHRVVVL